MPLDTIIDPIGVKAAVSAGNYAYLQIPTNSLRGFFDSLFPELAKNTTADIARGFAHRWTAGHDLLVDIPHTAFTKGAGEAAKQTGHILLTDFPTKAGIPIPGFSQSGLGEFLTTQCGIPKGYLSLNIADAGVGIFAMTESTFDLFNVISGQLRMSPELFLDTFVEGTIEIIAGVSLENPLLLIAGASEIAAGLISTFYTITHPLWYVNPLDFFCGGLSSAILSFLISKYVLKKDTKNALEDSGKSLVISSLFVISPFFGFAGIAALMACGIGKWLASKDNAELAACFAFSNTELTPVFKYLFPTLDIADKIVLNNSNLITFEDMLSGNCAQMTLDSMYEKQLLTLEQWQEQKSIDFEKILKLC